MNKAQPWSGPEDTPLGLNQVYSLAAGFITGCPSSNPSLPLKPFPALTASPANAASGTEVTYTFKGNASSYTAAYYYGLSVLTAKLDSSKKATIPKGLLGTYYTVIVRFDLFLLSSIILTSFLPQTTATDGNVTDANTVAGPLISVVDFPSTASDV